MPLIHKSNVSLSKSFHLSSLLEKGSRYQGQGSEVDKEGKESINVLYEGD